ncbi:MAG: VCBS repeat-containing protein [Anaerolineae bacterium]|nr:VCBS repeat-containing protein [Anaerolineae bacterium]
MQIRRFSKIVWLCCALVCVFGTTGRVVAQTPQPPERGTITSQTIDAARRGQPSPGYVPTAEELRLPERMAPLRFRRNVYMLIFNPTYLDGRPLTEYAGWNHPDVVTDLLAKAFYISVNGQYGFGVEEHVIVPDYPLFGNGARLTNALYEPCRIAFRDHTAVPEYCNVSPSDPQRSFSAALNLQTEHVAGRGTVCQALEAGTVDEVWIWMMPGSNAYEWYVENPESLCPGVTRQFAVMIFNYERGVDCALESFGHRAEWIMMDWTPLHIPAQIWSDFWAFTGAMWRYYDPYSDYICPAAPDATHPDVDPNNTHAGNVHLPPNAYCHYQYDRDFPVWSDAEDWKLNYPNLTGQKTLVNRETWGCPEGTLDEVCHANYLQWWFTHWPDRPMTPGSYVSWWDYVLFTVDQLVVMPLTLHPAPNSHGAPQNATVDTTYSWPIDPETVNNRSLAVFGSYQGLLEGAYTVDGDAITFAPQRSFYPGELIQATVTRKMQTPFFVPISRPWVWQFRAAAGAGPGTFMLNAEYPAGYPNDVVLADVNNDGLLDAVIASADDTVVVLKNISNGSYYRGGLFTPHGAYPVGENPHSLAVGDVDGDGDVDILTTSASADAMYVLRNHVNGTFLPAAIYPTGGAALDVTLGDIDGDGDLDALVGNGNAPYRLAVFTNNGDGTFADRVDTPAGMRPQFITLGDVDTDGDLDVFVNSSASSTVLRLLTNDGHGTFTQESVDFLTESNGVIVGDVDGDGDLDVLASNDYLDALSVLLNNGNGTFMSQVDYPLGGSPGRVAVGDVDGDGDLDALVTDIYAEAVVVFSNAGNGVFAKSSQTLVGHALGAIALGDVDGDKDLDALVTNALEDALYVLNNAAEPDVRIVVKDPAPNQNDAPVNGVFRIDYNAEIDATSVTHRTLALHGSQSGVLLGTYSIHNGTVQLRLPHSLHPGELVRASVTTGVRTDVGLRTPAGAVWEFRAAAGSGSGYSGDRGQEIGADGDVRDLALGDVDGDGDVDMVTVRADQPGGDALGVVYFNNGDGTFSESPFPVGAPGTIISKIRLGDMDGDGDLDIVTYAGNVGEEGWRTMVYYNDGDGTFDVVSYGIGYWHSSTPACLEVGDVDGDGDWDVVLGCPDGGRVYANAGTDGFPDRSVFAFAETDSMTDMALRDMDGDGDVDMVAGNNAGQSRVYFNDSRGYFANPVAFGDAADRVTTLDVGDLDGDGDLDVVTGQSHRPGKVYLNDGDGTFDTVSHTLPATGAATDVALGDVDGDGDLDAAFSFSDQPAAIYLNNGDGTFTASSGLSPQNSNDNAFLAPSFLQFSGAPATALALGDITGDGSLDLVTAGVGQKVMFYVNHHRLYLPLLLSQHIAPCYDAYEVDDTLAQANPIPTDGTPQVHTFHRPGDEDWVSFAVDNFSVAYDIETFDVSEGMDTVVYLYDSDGTTLLDWDDDVTPGAFTSHLHFQPYHSGTFYLQIKAYNPEGADCEATYSVRVTGESGE